MIYQTYGLDKKITASLEAVILYGAPEPVSEAKITECCFCERCPTKQGENLAADLRRRRLSTMRLGRSNKRSTASSPQIYTR